MGAELVPLNVILTDDPRWVRFPACPSCGEPGDDIGRLRIDRYGGLPRSEPQPVIRLRRCVHCGLVYKDIIPSPSYLTRLTMMHEAQLWSGTYGYGPEIALLDELSGTGDYDLLDIGAASGDLIRALEGRSGRHSALDIALYDRLRLGRGEFIKGFLDDEALQWSGDRYDVVTAFDVFEHFYTPAVAMRHLRAFCKPGGWVLIETGDADWTRTAKLPTWDYLGYYHHHMIWNAQSLAYAADASGFEVVSIARKAHKLKIAARSRALDRIKRRLYLAAPELYLGLVRRLRGDAYVPGDIGSVDHMRVVLRAKAATT